ncbi:hypothetical protein LCGC14_1970320, partial [marine sediment metagenome]
VLEDTGRTVARSDSLQLAKEAVVSQPGSYVIHDVERDLAIFTEDGGMTWETEKLQRRAHLLMVREADVSGN